MPEVSEFTILQTYKINSLNPDYWVEIQMDDIAVDTNNVITGPTIADADPLGVYSSVLEQSSSKEKKTRATSIYIQDNLVLDGTVNIQGIVQNQHLMIIHPQFDAFLFLLKVHSETSYHDIVQGMRKLEKDVEENKDELRTLIRNHFDQFILAQRTVESLNEEMKRKYNDNIPKEVVDFARSVRGTQLKFKEQIQPLLDRSERIKAVQNSQRALEKVKFFIDLPKQIKENRIKKRYELSVRDFKKGELIIQETAKLNNKSKIDFFKLVWKSAESQVEILQNELMELLEEDRSDQEETLILLMELNFPGSTLWAFMLERSHRLERSIKQEFSEFTPSSFQINATRVVDLQEFKLVISRILKSTTSKSIESTGIEMQEYNFWIKIYNVTQKIADVMCGPLNDFWKLSLVFLGENLKNKEFKDNPNIPEIEKTHQLVDKIIKYIAGEFEAFWQLNDTKSIFESVSKSPILTSYFLERIFNEFSRIERDISTMKYATGELCAKNILSVFESIKLKGLMITSAAWISESKLLGQSCNGIEIIEANEFDNSTLALFSLYQRKVLKDVLSLSSYSSISEGESEMSAENVGFYGEASNSIHPIILDKIRDVFVDSLHNFIVEMTRSVSESNEKMQSDNSLPLKCLAQIRIIAEILVPDLVAKFQLLTQTSLSTAALKVFKLINDMDESVFKLYISFKLKFVETEIQKTWNSDFFNWCKIKEPRGNH
eukprot:NODE_517_length_7343_cov_0.253313.p1 type:complete len:718 gc:universal NODE_517_length_7343_cov_0.253313:4446-2293(-)